MSIDSIDEIPTENSSFIPEEEEDTVQQQALSIQDFIKASAILSQEARSLPSNEPSVFSLSANAQSALRWAEKHEIAPLKDHYNKDELLQVAHAISSYAEKHFSYEKPLKVEEAAKTSSHNPPKNPAAALAQIGADTINRTQALAQKSLQSATQIAKNIRALVGHSSAVHEATLSLKGEKASIDSLPSKVQEAIQFGQEKGILVLKEPHSITKKEMKELSQQLRLEQGDLERREKFVLQKMQLNQSLSSRVTKIVMHALRDCGDFVKRVLQRSAPNL